MSILNGADWRYRTACRLFSLLSQEGASGFEARNRYTFDCDEAALKSAAIEEWSEFFASIEKGESDLVHLGGASCVGWRDALSACGMRFAEIERVGNTRDARRGITHRFAGYLVSKGTKSLRVRECDMGKVIGRGGATIKDLSRFAGRRINLIAVEKTSVVVEFIDARTVKVNSDTFRLHGDRVFDESKKDSLVKKATKLAKQNRLRDFYPPQFARRVTCLSEADASAYFEPCAREDLARRFFEDDPSLENAIEIVATLWPEDYDPEEDHDYAPHFTCADEFLSSYLKTWDNERFWQQAVVVDGKVVYQKRKELDDEWEDADSVVFEDFVLPF